MKPILELLTLLTLAGAVPCQAGLSHEIGWLPEPHGALVATEFADMNGDTLLDIVRLRRNTVEVLLQTPTTGRYVRVAHLALGVTAGPDLRGLAIGRLDASGDTRLDIAVVWSNGEVDVIHNGAGTTLTPIVPRPVPTLPAAVGVSILAADVSGDLIDDLIVLLEATPPQYLRGQAGGMFANLTLTNVPAAVAYPRPRATLADTDGDTDLDLVLCSTNPLPATLLLNQNGSFVIQPGAFANAPLPTGSVLAIDLVGSSLPELVFGRSGTVSAAPIVLTNFAGAFNSLAINQSLRLRGVLDMAAVDVNQNGIDDIVFLEATGKLGYALRGGSGTLIGQPTGVSTLTEPVPLLPPYPGRVCFAAGDHEGDGDVDLVAGGDSPDSLLLHGPGADFHDTERFAFPIGRRAADYAAALVDRDRNDDLDFVGLYPTGEWLALDNDGSGYFAGDLTPVSVALPPLSPATIWQELFSMSIAAGGDGDLLAFGDGSGVADQIAVLINHTGWWSDETVARFGGAVTGTIATVAPVPGGAGPDHLVIGTHAGELEFHENVGGAFVYQPAMFPAGLGLFNLTKLIVSDFDGNGFPDVLALSTANVPARLLLGSPSGFVQSPLAVPVTALGDQGIAANLDGDGDPDVLLRTTGQPGVTALLWNQVLGSFSVVGLGAISTVTFVVQDMAVVRVDGAQRIVLARDDGFDVVYAFNGAGYAGPVPISYRGTPATRGLLVADVERDGDTDILALRQGLDPVVINNETLHLQPLGPLQSGRSGTIQVGAPMAGSLSFISYGLPLNTPTPWGLLRLDPATMGTLFLGVAPASRQNFWNLSLGPGLPWIRFPIQAAWITPTNQIVLSGLEHLVISPQ